MFQITGIGNVELHSSSSLRSASHGWTIAIQAGIQLVRPLLLQSSQAQFCPSQRFLSRRECSYFLLPFCSMFINPHVPRARRKKRLPPYKMTERTSSMIGRKWIGDSPADVWRRQEQERSRFVRAHTIRQADELHSFEIRPNRSLSHNRSSPSRRMQHLNLICKPSSEVAVLFRARRNRP